MHTKTQIAFLSVSYIVRYFPHLSLVSIFILMVADVAVFG